MTVRQSATALLACALPISAIAGSPRLSTVFPAGGPRGGEIEIVCSGNNLADAREFLFDTPGFTVTEIKPPAEGEKNKIKAKVKVAPDVRLGEHSFRVVTASGISDLRLFYVSPFPLVEEAPDKENANKPQPVPLGTTVYGRTQGEDQDKYEVEAKKGQRISAEVIGARLQTGAIYDSFIVISKADGTVLTAVDDAAFTRQDPVASVVAPEDGKYVVTIKDATNSGPGECAYMLHIGSFPRPVAVYPPGGAVGEDLKVQLIGDALGTVEKTVKLSAQADEKFELFAEQGQPAPQPNFIRVAPFPNALEAEPNNEVASAPAVGKELPLALNGIIEKAGDVDCFKITAKKGVDYDVSVFARRLRSPLDSVLSIYDAKGSRIANNDDSGSPDSYIRWKAPADGEFIIGVNDQLLRGGPIFTYRVEIAPVAPRVTVWLPEMVQNSNQERRAIVVPKGNRYASLVRVKRWDVGGDIQLEPKDLPPGVTVITGPIDKSVDTVPVVFEAAPDAQLSARAFEFKAKLTAPETANTPSRVEQDIDVAENGNQKSFYSLTENKLAVAVAEEIPVKLTLVQPKVPVLQTGSMNIKVVAERKGDFKGPISIALLYAPPGIASAGTFQIKEGENETLVPISANGNAALAKWKICVVGSADFGKGTVWFSTQLAEIEVAAPYLAGSIARTFIDQGDSTIVTVKLDQKAEFPGKAKLTLSGLPPGTTAEEKEITKDDKEVKITVKAAPDAQPGLHKQIFAAFTLLRDGEPMVSTFAQGGILRVDKASVAKKEDPKK